MAQGNHLTDAELIDLLRGPDYDSGVCRHAADRVEALRFERDALRADLGEAEIRIEAAEVTRDIARANVVKVQAENAMLRSQLRAAEDTASMRDQEYTALKSERDALMHAANPVGFGLPTNTVDFCVRVITRMRMHQPVIRPAASSKELHVYPVHDLREHDMARTCFCQPTPDTEEANLWIHHAADMRERMKS